MKGVRWRGCPVPGSSGRDCAETIWPLMAGRGEPPCLVSAWALSGRWVWLAATTTCGWPFAIGLMALASACLSTSGMAYLTIRGALVELHKEMEDPRLCGDIRFVTFRVLHDYGPTSNLQPEGDRAVTLGWASWVVPLAVAEMMLQWKPMKTALLARK
jgi:hypothetical protein